MSEHVQVDFETFVQIRESYRAEHMGTLLPETVEKINLHLEEVHLLKRPQSSSDLGALEWAREQTYHQAAVMRGQITLEKLSEPPSAPEPESGLISLLRRFNLRRLLNR